MVSNHPKVAVVLGQGGLRPFAALPLFTFLEENNIPVDLLVGCSGGSIVSAFIAAGYKPDFIEKNVIPRITKSFFKLNWKTLLSIIGIPVGSLGKHGALINPKTIVKLGKEYLKGKNIEDLNIKTIFQVTDFDTGEGVGLESGDLIQSMLASSANFPILPPVKIGERWFFDGAFTSPIPILQAVKKGANVIIAVDFQDDLQSNKTGVFNSIMHICNVFQKTIGSQEMTLSIDLHPFEIIYMKVKYDIPVDIFDFKSFPVILGAGEKALGVIKDELLYLCNKTQEL